MNKQLLNFNHIRLCKLSLEKHIFRIANPAEPIIATAIHAGHEMPCFLLDHSALTDEERRYEEDPYTDDWAGRFPNHIIVNRSRFEVDLNRSRDKAVYLTPADAWGLQVWEHLPPRRVINRLYESYDEFYDDLNCAIRTLTANNPVVLVLDLHSYNHRRGGIIAPEEQNPQVNIGTGTTGNPERWRSIIDCTIDELRNGRIDETPLDVRENIKFKGGHMAAWLHHRYPESVCVLSIEVKKIFMDELSGVPNHEVTATFSDYFQNIRTVLLKMIHEIW